MRRDSRTWEEEAKGGGGVYQRVWRGKWEFGIPKMLERGVGTWYSRDVEYIIRVVAQPKRKVRDW